MSFMDIANGPVKTNKFPIAAPIYWGSAFFMFLSMCTSYGYRALYLGNVFSVGTQFSFFNILLFLAIAALGVFMMIRMRLGINIAAVTIFLIAAVDGMMAMVRYMGYYGNFGRAFLALCYYGCMELAFLAYAAVNVLFGIPKTKALVKKLWFVPGAVMGLALFFFFFSGISVACKWFLLFSQMALVAAMIFGGMWAVSEEMVAEAVKEAPKQEAPKAAPVQEAPQAQASVIVSCPSCQGKMRLPVGRNLSVTCPHCGNKFTSQT